MGSPVSVLSVLSVLSVSPPDLPAQQATAAGRVVVPRATDTIPLPGVRVLLHRVGRDRQGPIDSAIADRAGRFRFRFRADSGALYLLSTSYGGIEYFSPPVHTNPARPDTGVRLLAYDTSSTAAITVEARHIVVPRAGADGARAVLDLIVLRNDGARARVAPDSMHPTWTMMLPAGTGEMQVGESDLSPDAVVRVGDTVKVLAPLAPGQKQLSIEYATAPVRGRITFPVGRTDTPVNLLVEDRDARVSGGTLALVDTQVIEGRSFLRYAGHVAAGSSVALTVGVGPAGRSSRILAALVGAVGIVLLATGIMVLGRRRRFAPAAAPVPVAQLLDAIAALDARYAGHEADTTSDEWERYRSERAALKHRLEGALAAGGRGPYV